jgi:hypothetical protein
MRTLVLYPLLGAALGAAACGTKNECEKLLDLTYDAWSEACGGKSEACCFCKCWNEGHRLNDYNSSSKKCECNVAMPSSVPDESCTDAYKAQTKTCLDNAQTCTDGLKRQIDDPAHGRCTTTPLN